MQGKDMEFDYDLFVLGAGSGGCALVACLPVTVPRSLWRNLCFWAVPASMWAVSPKNSSSMAHFREEFQDAKNYGWDVRQALLIGQHCGTIKQ